MRPSAASPLTRRSMLVLAAGGALALAGCSLGADPEPTAPATEEADAALTGSVAEQEQLLIALYDATLVGYPALAPMITALRDEHVAHREALVAEVGSSAVAPTPAVASSEAAALTALLEAERQAVGQRSDACASAQGPETTRLLALIAASEAGHVEFLREASA